MTCGLGLGIFLVFWVQAERVGCFWTKEAQNLQNSNTHVGFPPPTVRLIKSGSYPQNQGRQGFSSPHMVQSSSSNTGPAVHTGSGPGLSTRSSAHVSQPALSSVRLVQSRPKSFSPRAKGPKAAKQSSDLIEEKQHKNQKNPSRGSKTPKKGKHSSKTESQQGSKKRNLINPGSLLSAAQALSKVASNIPFYHREVGSSSSLYDPVAPGHSVQTQTYARSPAKRLSSNRKSKATSVLPQTQDRRPPVGHEGGASPRSWPQTYKISRGPAVPRSSIKGTPVQSFATVYQIPEHFGGFGIRRLRKPAQNQVTVSKLQTPTAAPQQKPFSPQSGYPEVRWTRVKI
ncbi:uncharacterized protein LOC106521105 isoform X3 [Austrofundulus limnaeus]|uniref:Uncharacterized protein LOC106521105 isoform X3 n=1 Tax=Austrofundulus limnaeus TaxID=52670 RepID=A0A2I4BMK9_AUSLI|nr:PREDICTED: uncharacterized protein LOC106521105 isoform X3 [Austrofundulus limnaeus]